MKKILTAIAFSGVLVTQAAGAASSTGSDPGGIIFIGDSITQGGTFNGYNVASYRYQLFKNFVDNGVSYDPMGMTEGASKGVSVPTSDYRGYTFDNTSEAAASGRSYQYASHEAGSVYKSDPGTVANSANRGPLSVKFGLEDPYTGSTNQFYNGSTLTTYTGETYESKYGNKKAQTACIMIGINDIFDKNGSNGQTDEQIIANVQRIVTTLQQYNDSINVIVMGLLPVGQNNGAYTKGVDEYNAQLQTAVATWSTESSAVTYADVSTGFYATNGAMVDGNGGAHPNAQGELIVAGNLARVLGVGQRTMGYERKDTVNLASHADLSSATPSIALAASSGGQLEVKTFTVGGTSTSQALSAANGQLTFAMPKNNSDNYLKLAMDGTNSVVRVATYNITLKMNLAEDGNDASNCFSVFIGDGVSGAGILYVGEDGITWAGNSNQLLYGAPYSTESGHFFTQEEISLRIVVDSNGDGSAGLYNIWLGDQLIGENLAVNLANSYKDNVLLGKTSKSHATYATLSDFSMELGVAYAAAGADNIPEPTTATLSLLALAGLAARRRRQ